MLTPPDTSARLARIRVEEMTAARRREAPRAPVRARLAGALRRAADRLAPACPEAAEARR